MKLCRLNFKILLLLVLLGFSGALSAAVAPALYQVQTPVASHSPADWDKAASAALAQVLVKISGNPAIVQDSAVARALGRASNYVQSFNYVTGASPNALLLNIRFSPKAVDGLLQANQPANANQLVQAQAPAPASRPLTLVWLALQDSSGQPKLLTDNQDPTLVGLQQQADQTGLPLLWPAGDLEDISSVSPNQVWQLDQGAVQQASQRYQAGRILLGKLEQQANGSWQGDWVLLGDQSNTSWQTQGSSSAQAATAVVAKLASTAGGSGSLQAANGASQQLSMTVEGITGLNDYTALINYLHSLSSVADVSATQMGGDRIVLNISLNTDQNAFVNALSQDSKLVTVNTQNPSSQSALGYRWTGANTAAPVLGATSGGIPSDSGNPNASNGNAQSFPVTQAQTPYTADSSNTIPEEVSP